MGHDALRRGSLNLLRTFEAAARLGSFKAAADELCVTPSAVSQQVRVLEELVGVALFERRARGLRLNDTGVAFLADIQPPLTALVAATDRLCRTRNGILRVSLMPPLASRIVLPRLADFQARYPRLELRLDTRIDVVDLQRHQADLAIRYGSPPWPGCTHEKLADLYAQAVCPPALALRLTLAEHPENLARAPLVQMTGRPESWPQYFAQLGLTAAPERTYHVDDYPAAIEAAATLGAALAIMPLEKPLLDSGKLVAAGPLLGPLPDAMYAVMRTERRGDPALVAFVDWLRRQLQDLVGG